MVTIVSDGGSLLQQLAETSQFGGGNAAYLDQLYEDWLRDPQSVANGYLQPCVTSEGNEFELVAAPVQFDEVPAQPGRSPDFNEHGDAILEELGLDWDTVVDLKVRGVTA